MANEHQEHTRRIPSMNGTPSSPVIADYCAILYKWRRFLIINTLIVGVLITGVAFVLPKWYKASATILPPKDNGLLNLLGGSSNSLLRGLGSLSKIGGSSQSSGSYNYLALLNSRTMMEAVVNKFQLVEVYGIGDQTMDKAVKELEGNVQFEYGDNDEINVTVMDKDPQRAADVANFFVDQLNEMSIRIGTQEARGNREFIANRVSEVEDSLRQAEDQLKTYQEKSGMVLTPEQTAGANAIGELYGMKAKKEIEIAVLKTSATSDNEQLHQLEMEEKAVDDKLAVIPSTGLQVLRLYRDVVAQEKILEFLYPVLEQAKLEEQKDVPVLIILDRAIKPEHKFRPQRLLMIAAVSVIWLMVQIVLAFLFQGALARRLETAKERQETKLTGPVAKLASAYRIDVR
jgi:uncharacterized protein involved in exopolysaccharide biosynthesis